MKRITRISLVLSSLCLGVSVLSPAVGAASKLEFNRDIRPILSDNCFSCHGPDKNKRKGKLRLDDRENALQKDAIVPGKPEESELIKRIFTTNEDDLMPTPESNKQLTLDQRELFRKWIAQGAKYEPHWAYIKPERPQVPAIRSPKFEIRNPIDAFILQPLAKSKIEPSPETDKRTLLRRLSLDLIGLPPTIEEVDNFVADKSKDAYEKQVERLLASPHYGERWGRLWLDAARYADSDGFEKDKPRFIWN